MTTKRQCPQLSGIVTWRGGGSKLARLMAGQRNSRFLLNGALIALLLAYPALPSSPSELLCPVGAQSAPSEKGKTERQRCKRSDGARAPTKGCTDGGERLPQDRRSPFDTIPPLSPLVA